ncbi:MAG: myxococcus cysteine-rich repeat containing protein [Nanoarchaeota archaeon]
MLINKKKGVSVLIGYVLLVVFAVIIAAIVFTWLKSYVPADTLKCPDGVSVFINELTFDNSTREMNLSIRNNGRFDIAGYFIHATNSSSQELPTIDLSAYLNQNYSAIKFGNSVIIQDNNISLIGEGNLFRPGDQKSNIFDIPAAVGQIYSVRIIPTRFQEEDNKQRFASCSDAKVQQPIGAQYICVPDCSGKVCGGDGCGGSCAPGCNSSTEFCDAVGQCISNTCTPVSNPCGTMVCGTATNGTCGQVSCGTCSGGLSCNASGQCVGNCGNGAIETGETCDDGDAASGDGCSSTCQIESGWSCTGQPSQCYIVNSCPSYCTSLSYGSGFCTNSAGNCQSGGGTYESGGDPLCIGGSQADTCCCVSGSGSTFLFFDNFEGYTNNRGIPLYNEMAVNGWTIIDNTHPITDDDVYLNNTIQYQGVYSVLIQDESEIMGNISTTGYNNINFGYARRTLSLEGSERFRIYWRVGSTGTWTQLESTNSVTWQQQQWSLTGAENKSLIQIRFFLDGENTDYGLADNITITGS